MQPHTHWVKRDAIEATVAKYLLENEGLRFIGALLKYLELPRFIKAARIISPAMVMNIK